MRGAFLWLVLGAIAHVVMPVRSHARSPGAVYQSDCARCHGAAGRADTPISRALKVPPLVHDGRLAHMTPEEIAKVVKGDPKHRSIVRLRSADLEAAAVFVKELAARGDD